MKARLSTAFVLGALAVLAAAGAAAAPAVSIELSGNVFEVTGWHAPAAPPAAGWSSIFSVYAGRGDIPALLGTYTVEHGILAFHPRFPLTAGLEYRAVFEPPGGGSSVERLLSGPPKATSRSARVLHVYPSADVLPSNQLRLYIYFSAPMSRGEAARYIHILDAQGRELRNVFLPAEELWDANYERLTLTFDPGRIKRGLTSNQELGPPIADGKRYTLVIDGAWPDARGVSLAAGFRKSFRGGPAKRTAPEPQRWRVTAPQAGTTGALVVDFPAPMNYPLLQRMLAVAGATGGVPGTVSVAAAETEWRFTPEQPWRAGNYRIVIDTRLEDLAGNNLEHLFDIDTFKRVTEHLSTRTVSLPFTIR